MKCPHCEKPLSFVAPVDLNCETYGGHPKGVTECCGNIVQLRRQIVLIPSIPYNHDELTEDDWNIKKKPK